MSRERLCIATPMQSPLSLSAGYVRTIRNAVLAVGDTGVDVDFVDMREMCLMPSDLVRTRSRMVHEIRKVSEAAWVLWLDDDMEVEARAIVYMLGLARHYKLGVVGAAYPRKFFDEKALVDKLRWAIDIEQRVEKESAIDVERAREVLRSPLRFAFSQKSYAIYNLTRRKGPASPHPWLWQVDGLGMGCMLMSRECLDRMTEHYGAELGYEDEHHGTVAALFQLRVDARKKLTSEDSSFCGRWRDIGGEVFAYVGPGRVSHHGHQEFESDISCLVGETYARALEKICSSKST